MTRLNSRGKDPRTHKMSEETLHRLDELAYEMGYIDTKPKGKKKKKSSGIQWTNLPLYRKNRKLCRIRDGWKCVKCSSTERLTTHHIVPRNNHEENDHSLDNLLTMCWPCHRALHSSLSA